MDNTPPKKCGKCLVDFSLMLKSNGVIQLSCTTCGIHQSYPCDEHPKAEHAGPSGDVTGGHVHTPKKGNQHSPRSEGKESNEPIKMLKAAAKIENTGETRRPQDLSPSEEELLNNPDIEDCNDEEFSLYMASGDLLKLKEAVDYPFSALDDMDDLDDLDDSEEEDEEDDMDEEEEDDDNCVPEEEKIDE